MSATLTPEELSEIVAYLRVHPAVKLVQTDLGPVIQIKDTAAMDPRRFLELIRSVDDDKTV